MMTTAPLVLFTKIIFLVAQDCAFLPFSRKRELLSDYTLQIADIVLNIIGSVVLNKVNLGSFQCWGKVQNYPGPFWRADYWCCIFCSIAWLFSLHPVRKGPEYQCCHGEQTWIDQRSCLHIWASIHAICASPLSPLRAVPGRRGDQSDQWLCTWCIDLYEGD